MVSVLTALLHELRHDPAPRCQDRIRQQDHEYQDCQHRHRQHHRVADRLTNGDAAERGGNQQTQAVGGVTSPNEIEITPMIAKCTGCMPTLSASGARMVPRMMILVLLLQITGIRRRPVALVPHLFSGCYMVPRVGRSARHSATLCTACSEGRILNGRPRAK